MAAEQIPCLECECDRRCLTFDERRALAAQFTGMLAAVASEQPNDPIPEPEDDEAPL